MGNTLTIRIPEDLAVWLEETSQRSGVPKGRIVKDELERARAAEEKPWMRLAGAVASGGQLRARRGFEGQPKPGKALKAMADTRHR